MIPKRYHSKTSGKGFVVEPFGNNIPNYISSLDSYKGHVGKTQRSICEIRETATFDKPTFSPKNATDRIKLKVGLVATTKEKTKDASMRRLLTLLPSVTFPTHILPNLESNQNVSPLFY